MNCCGLLLAGVVLPALVSAQDKIAPKLLLEDFRIARNSLEEGHSGIYRHTSKAELDREFDAAAGRIDHPMTALEFYRLLAPVAARIKCGHTAVNPPRDLQREMNRSVPLFPLQVEVLGGNVFVFREYSAEEHGLEGQEIRRINGMPVETILSTMLAATPGDGDSRTVRPWRIGHGGSFPRVLLEDLRDASDAGGSSLDTETLASLDRGLADIAAGRVKSLDEYKRERGL